MHHKNIAQQKKNVKNGYFTSRKFTFVRRYAIVMKR